MNENNDLDGGKTFSHRFVRFVLGNRGLVILFSLAISVLAAMGGKHITMSSDYRYYFGENNPQRIAFEEFQKVYNKDDSVLIGIEPPGNTVFNETTLTLVREMTKDAWTAPYSYRVDSLSNFQHSYSKEDDLIVRDLVKESDNLNQTRLNEVRDIALNEPLLKDQIVSSNGAVTGLNIRVNLPGKTPMEVPEVANFSRELVDKYQKKYPDHKFYLSGIAMLNNAFNEAAMTDMSTLTPIMYLVILAILAFFLRSFFTVISTLVILVLSVMAAMGMSGWLGIPLTPPSSIAPTVILTLAIADSVHILKSIIGFMKKGWQKREAIAEGLRINLQPVFLTSLTTAIGFLSLNASDTPPFHDLGNITAVGVLFAFILSVTLLPVLTDLMPLNIKPAQDNKEEKEGNALSKWVITNRKGIMLTTMALSLFLGYQVPKIKLNDQFVQYFSDKISFRSDTDWVMRKLTGIYQINFNIPAKESQGITDPEYLKKVDEFAQYVRSIPGVSHVNTLTDTFKRLNKNMHGDDPSYYSLPESRELAAQYLLLYEMSLPYGLDLNNQIDVDKSATRTILSLGNLATEDMLKINQKAEQWLVENTPSYMHAKGTSPAVMFSHISKNNVKSMAWGTIFAFVLITITMIIALKSFKYGLLSLLPNMIPASFAFGIWSLGVGEAGFAIAMVGSVTLGIVVDDTVHFLTKYVRAIREKKLSPEEAIADAIGNVGPALLATSVILTAGFCILLMSAFKVNWTLGALSAMTIAIALIIDVTFLPALLYVTDRGSKFKNTIGGNMKMKNVLGSILLGVVAIGLSTYVNASTPEAKGLEIAKLIDSHDLGWVNQTAEVEMILKNKHGQESKRNMIIKTLEVKGDGDKSLTLFKKPRDVKGTSFLSFTHAIGSDDQWIYLPALRRVKRISSENKSGPFMGSEFAYEDISSQEVDKYKYKYIRADKINGMDGHVIERYPVDKNSGYTKQIAWIDSKAYRIHKVDFYDRKGSLLKTLEFRNYKKYLDSTWRPDEMFISNHQNGKSTLLVWKNYKFKTSLSSRDFDKNALKRLK